ncbi:uncharacterized protein BcabD6B2_30170 [Babesia caballi]|uniref:Uncharacterized protein n=1 Tax=Babesia caballi TaxID=5871 RepID=A0AAV4LVE2_BABCB|nr:hypothetical protein BcabD6B2_30170 [Babesia caballi]
MVHSTRLLTASRQHGWRFEKLRPTFKKWVRINHPPQVRSLLLKLDPESNKLLYVCNGRISPRHCATYEKAAKHFIKKGEVLETPVLAIVKGGSHVLLETLCMDDVEQLEKLVPEIRKAFDGGCETVVGGLSRGAAPPQGEGQRPPLVREALDELAYHVVLGGGHRRLLAQLRLRTLRAHPGAQHRLLHGVHLLGGSVVLVDDQTRRSALHGKRLAVAVVLLGIGDVGVNGFHGHQGRDGARDLVRLEVGNEAGRIHAVNERIGHVALPNGRETLDLVRRGGGANHQRVLHVAAVDVSVVGDRDVAHELAAVADDAVQRHLEQAVRNVEQAAADVVLADAALGGAGQAEHVAPQHGQRVGGPLARAQRRRVAQGGAVAVPAPEVHADPAAALQNLAVGAQRGKVAWTNGIEEAAGEFPAEIPG